MKKSLLGLVGLVACLGASGCGGSGGGTSSPATYASALEACSEYCEAYFAACAPPAYSTSGQCKITLCSPIPSTASRGCYTATQTWYDCRKAESDLCGGAGCTDEAAAAQSSCP